MPDRAATRDLARAQLMQGKMELARETLKPLTDVNHPNPEGLTGYAWAALFTKNGEPEAIDVVQLANNLTDRRSYAILHTLACLYADTAKEREARETLLQAMEAAHISEPDDGIWFGLGEIADEYGEQSPALAAYGRVKRPNKPEMEPDSTWSLAQERIRVLSREAQKTASISVPRASDR